MRNSKTMIRCNKRQLSKAKWVVRTYNDVQDRFADILENDTSIKDFICNYPLSDFPIENGKYTSDFYRTHIFDEHTTSIYIKNYKQGARLLSCALFVVLQNRNTIINEFCKVCFFYGLNFPLKCFYLCQSIVR